MNIRYIALVFLAGIYLHVCAGSAPTASPKFIFGPIGMQAKECSALSPEWHNKIKKTLLLAQERTKGFLPAESWSGLLDSSHLSAAEASPLATVDLCEKFVAFYSDPALSARFRGIFVMGTLLQAHAGCAAEFPDLAILLRTSWVEAFRRNGFDPDEKIYDDAVLHSWRKPSGDELQRKACEKSISFFSGGDFDAAASEASIRRFLYSSQ